MKRNLILTLSAIVALGVSFNSCNTTPSTKIALANEADSISYSFGASVAENLEGYLRQSGIVVDTFAVVMEYEQKLASESDEAKKAKLLKEKKSKVDSLNRANEQGIADFLSGFDAGVNARESKNNYNAGLAVGSQIAQQAIPNIQEQFLGKDSKEKINRKAIVAAVSATVQKKDLMMPNASTYLMMKSQGMQQKEMETQSKQGETNRLEGEKFLEENKTKEGVVTLPSGLQYKILTEGTGEKPKPVDQVMCHYHGKLLDGTVFDSSVDRGQPATFPVVGVIPGWVEILQLMPTGSKWEVYVPYDLAYGEQGTGREIGPFATLKFQIELLQIIPHANSIDHTPEGGGLIVTD